MRLEFIEVCGFRGVREKLRLDLPPGFAVISGHNGVGKSTVLDAVEFALTGTIAKYAVTSAKGGGLAQHLWWVGSPPATDHYVSVGFIDDRGERTRVTRHRERGIEGDLNELFTRICRPGLGAPGAWPAILQTTLVRDELISAMSLDLPEEARFTALRSAMGAITGQDYSRRTQDIVQACKQLKSDQDAASERARAELSRALEAVTEGRSLANRFPDVSDALRLADVILGGLSGTQSERLTALRAVIANRKARLDLLGSLRTRSEQVLTEHMAVTSDGFAAELREATATNERAQKELDSAREALTAAQRLEAKLREEDALAAHLAGLLEHGTAIGLRDGHCPLCLAAQSNEAFTAGLQSVANELQERRSRIHGATTDARAAVAQFDAATLRAQRSGMAFAALNERRSSNETVMAKLLNEYATEGLSVPGPDPAAVRSLIANEQSELRNLEQAVLVLESSGAADRVAALEARVLELREKVNSAAGRVAAAATALERAKQIQASSLAVANEVLTEQFDTVMPLLKELFRRLRPHPDWTDIDSDFGGRIRGSLNFVVGGHNPQFLFSSGQRRAAGLSFLLALHLSRPWCAWRTLLLDDPVQHIDDYRALNLAEVLAAIRRKGEQVIVAVEDAALADVLCRRLRSMPAATGRRFELRTSQSGGAELGRVLDVFPMSEGVLELPRAS